jgi:hypothetical protein
LANITITVSNKLKVKGLPDRIKQYFVDKLRIPDPKYAEAASAGRSLWGMKEFIYNFTILSDSEILIPRGMLLELTGMLTQSGKRFDLIDNRTSFPHLTLDSRGIKFRPYQSRAISEVVSTFNEGLLIAPPGSGKTVMGLSLIPLTGQPTLWLTHTGPLADQAEERAKAFLPDIGEIGRIGGGKWNIGEVLTIGMIQTLVRNQPKMLGISDEFGLVVLDEAHHCPARTFFRSYNQF